MQEINVIFPMLAGDLYLIAMATTRHQHQLFNSLSLYSVHINY